MSKLFKAVSAFYGGDALLKASFTDLCFLASDLGRSLVSGDAVEVKSSDGYINRRKQIAQTSRLDTIICLARISAVLETKLKDLPAKELEALDRMRQMVSGSELPKRLDHPEL